MGVLAGEDQTSTMMGAQGEQRVQNSSSVRDKGPKDKSGMRMIWTLSEQLEKFNKVKNAE